MFVHWCLAEGRHSMRIGWWMNVTVGYLPKWVWKPAPLFSTSWFQLILQLTVPHFVNPWNGNTINAFLSSNHKDLLRKYTENFAHSRSISIGSSHLLLPTHWMLFPQIFSQKRNHLASSFLWNFPFQMNSWWNKSWVVVRELSLTLCELGLQFYVLRCLPFLSPKKEMRMCICSLTPLWARQ
jgi:hypothetical protein